VTAVSIVTALAAVVLASKAGDGGATASAPAPVPAAGSAALDPAAVVAEVRRIVAEAYVLPERRPAIDAALADGLRRGRYDVRDPALLAERIDADLKRVGRDGHLYFRHEPVRVAALTAAPAGGPPGGPPDMAFVEQAARAANHGVRELRVLPGNVRYLDLSSFEWTGPESEAVLNGAAAFLARGDALIVDVRRNGGGSGRAVHQLVSHFLKAGTPLITFHKGAETSPTMRSLPGLGTLAGKPLFVLASGATGSAAEEFVGHVAGYKLGEVVGEATSGAAYMNDIFPVAGRFELSVSVARPVLAATGRDWEGSGIAPTVPVAAERALAVAQVRAVRALAARADPARRAALGGLAEGLVALDRPGRPTAAPAAYAGDYGARRIVAVADGLWYEQERRPRRRLVALGGDRFTLADDPAARLDFRMAGGRAASFDLSQAGGPVQARFERAR